MKTKEQIFIKSKVIALLNNLRSLFDKNELAYYSLQGKNELQIRDKIAWHLQSKLDCKFGSGKYIVRREWSPPSDSSKKVDMAILKVIQGDMNNNKSTIVALFEFKAHQFVNNEDWPYAAFYADVKKMWEICDKNGFDDVDMYFIFLHSAQNKNQITGGFGDAVAYKDLLNKAHVSLSPQSVLVPVVTDYWNGFFDDNVIYDALYLKDKSDVKKHFSNSIASPSIPSIQYHVRLIKPIPCFQRLGKSFDYEWHIAPMVWGPYTINDISIN